MNQYIVALELLADNVPNMDEDAIVAEIGAIVAQMKLQNGGE